MVTEPIEKQSFRLADSAAGDPAWEKDRGNTLLNFEHSSTQTTTDRVFDHCRGS
jgi:hypothetical protein